MAILLHDGLSTTYRTSICHVLPYGTTGRLGLSAFFEHFSGFEFFCSPALSRPVQPEVTHTVSLLSNIFSVY
jgi:hypothetical protein